jgi:hypothetical protein
LGRVENDCLAAGFGAVSSDRGNLQMRAQRLLDADQFTELFEFVKEVTQLPVRHDDVFPW